MPERLVEPPDPERLACRRCRGHALIEQLRRARRQQRKRQQVVPVVFQHRTERPGIAGPHVVEIARRESRIRHVAFALVTEQRGLEAAETVALVVAMPETPGVMEHVDVRHLRKRRRQPVQGVACLDEREIEGLAVVGDDGIQLIRRPLRPLRAARARTRSSRGGTGGRESGRRRTSRIRRETHSCPRRRPGRWSRDRRRAGSAARRSGKQAKP